MENAIKNNSGNEIMSFEFRENHEKLECVNLNGEPLFNPFTVGKCLGIAEQTVKNTISHLDPEDLLDLKSEEGKQYIPYFGMTAYPRYWLRESGLYLMIFKSRKPEAESFKKWVARDVIPSIRKTGSYSYNKPSQSRDIQSIVNQMNSSAKTFFRGFELITGITEDELAISQGETWNKKLSNLMIDCSRNNMGTMKDLYDELFYLFSTELGVDVEEIARSKGFNNRMKYIQSNPALSRNLYEFALNHFKRKNRQVCLYLGDQKTLDHFN